ncbi:hypothetical protein PC113_g21906 [Phytophthora cactorum]|uniref:Uncharacterized protein n=1 Tax=Phytophthora cactorum TaxID=29920 RepID=A0A8T0Y464_9STRA|nr:hypothetical protein PC113_g21906 [Phytophthora cactorum]
MLIPITKCSLWLTTLPAPIDTPSHSECVYPFVRHIPQDNANVIDMWADGFRWGVHPSRWEYNAIMKLLQRFAKRHGFSLQTEPATKKKEADVVETHVTFALEFWGKYGVKHTAAEIYNVDETVIYYDTPLKEIWAIRDHKGYAKIRKTETQRARMTSVLAARADAKTTSNFVYCAR